MDEKGRSILLSMLRQYANNCGVSMDYMYHTGDEFTRLYFITKNGFKDEALIKWDLVEDSPKTFGRVSRKITYLYLKEKNMKQYEIKNGAGISVKDVIDEIINSPNQKLKGDITTGYTYYNYCYNPPKTSMFDIERVIFNEPATIILWKDGTKTVVKADGDVFDPEKGLAMAIAKKALGNQGNYFNTIRKWRDTYKPKDMDIIEKFNELPNVNPISHDDLVKLLKTNTKIVDDLNKRLETTFLKDSDI